MVSDWRVYWHKLTRVKWRLVGYGPADETDSRQTCYVVLYCLWTYRLHWMHYLTCIARYSFVWVTSCILYACVDSRGVFMMKNWQIFLSSPQSKDDFKSLHVMAFFSQYLHNPIQHLPHTSYQCTHVGFVCSNTIGVQAPMTNICYHTWLWEPNMAEILARRTYNNLNNLTLTKRIK